MYKYLNVYLSNRLCPFRFNFLTVQGIYAELQPRRDRYFSTERTCSVYFKYTRFFIRFVSKCQLKSGCFYLIAFFRYYHISMIGLLKEVRRITENANGFRVLPCFEDFETIFAFILNSLTNRLFRTISSFARCFSQ